MTSTFVCLMFTALAAEPAFDWPAVVQQPYEASDSQGPFLSKLLGARSGEKIDTPAEWETERRRLSTAWRARLGKSPGVPRQLDVEVLETTTLADHARRLVRFRTEGDDRLRTYLLIPKGLKTGERRPVVVVFHQTNTVTFREPVGLAGDKQSALALELVRRGYVTLSPECYLLKGKGPLEQAKVLAARRPGWTGLGKVTFDASRCVDFLETVPEVDRARIGCIGHSLGAKEVLFAMALEPRYRAGVFSEGGIGLSMSNWTDPWYLTAAMNEHRKTLDNHQVLALAAPRPLLVIAGNSADTAASWSYVREARTVYRLLGAGNRVGFYNHGRGHVLPPPARDLAYRWLDDWLDFSPMKLPSPTRSDP